MTPRIVAVVAFLLYMRTLAPGVVSLNNDTLEFQLVALRGAIPHPTGYPLFAILLTLAARLIPFGEVAARANLVSALSGAVAVGLTVAAGRALGIRALAAVVAAALIGLAPTFWAQATVAEVYPLHIALCAALVWRLLRWGENPARPPYDVALLLGLGLAHHRMMVLWLPAVLLYAFLVYRRHGMAGADDNPPTVRVPTVGDFPRNAAPAILRVALVGLLPLLTYLWLPLRASVGSIDGTYQEVGFTCWVTACQYGAFLGDNALAAPTSPLFFATLTGQELGTLGIILLAIGTIFLYKLPRPSLLFIIAGFATNALFALLYRVPDPEVFWLPALWVLCLIAGWGVHHLLGVTEGIVARRGNGARWVTPVLLFLLIVAFTPRLLTLFPRLDRSTLTGHPTLNGEPINGRDILNQPFPPNSVVIGLLGEITYLRYLQEAHGLTPTLATAGGDNPDLRRAAVDRALAQGQIVFLTRELEGLDGGYTYSALGPLIQVVPTPRTTVPDGLYPLDLPITPAITLASWTRSPIAASDLQRLTVAYRVTAPVDVPLHISARLVTATGDIACEGCQVDTPPVRDMYPTTAWREGEVILDTYDLPAPPAGSRYLLIFYDPATGAEVARAIIDL